MGTYAEEKLDEDFQVFKKYRCRSTLQGKLRQMVQTEGITRFLYYAIGRCGKMSKMRATNFNVEQRYFNCTINNVVVHFLAIKHPFIRRARFISTEEGNFGIVYDLSSFKRHGKYGGAIHVFFHVHHLARASVRDVLSEVVGFS